MKMDRVNEFAVRTEGWRARPRESTPNTWGRVALTTTVDAGVFDG